MGTVNLDAHALTHVDPAHAKVVLVDWMLGNHCNFACDYCPTNLHDGSIDWISLGDATRFLAQLHAHYVEGLGRNLWLQLTGGEPTQYPRFFDLCASAKSLDIKVAVISNGSRTARFWEKAASVLSSAILTYHDLQVDHARFIETLRILEAAGVPVHVNVTAHPDRFENIMASAEDILAQSVAATLTVKPLRIGFGTELYPYSDAQMARLAARPRRVARNGDEVRKKAAWDFQRGLMLRWLSDGTTEKVRANDLILAGENHWRSFRCQAGLESLRVKADGTVYRAVCGSGGCLGRIGEDSLDLPVVPVTCDRDSCACVSDILITKMPPLSRSTR